MDVLTQHVFSCFAVGYNASSLQVLSEVESWVLFCCRDVLKIFSPETIGMRCRLGRKERGAGKMHRGDCTWETGACYAFLTACSLARLLARCLEVLPELPEECCMHLASHPSCRMHRLQQHLGVGQVSMLRDLSARAALPPGRRLPSIQVDFSLKFLFFVLISCTLSNNHSSLGKDAFSLTLPAWKPDGTEALLLLWSLALAFGVVYARQKGQPGGAAK